MLGHAILRSCGLRLHPLDAGHQGFEAAIVGIDRRLGQEQAVQAEEMDRVVLWQGLHQRNLKAHPTLERVSSKSEAALEPDGDGLLGGIPELGTGRVQAQHATCESTTDVVDGVAIGSPLRAICDPLSRRKFDNMVAVARDKRAVYDWSLNLPIAGAVRQVHFSAGVSDERLLIVAGDTRGDEDQMFEELVRLNSDQTNSLRAALKELSILRRLEQAATPVDDSLLAFTQLNNELANLQRDAVRRSAELHAVAADADQNEP